MKTISLVLPVVIVACVSLVLKISHVFYKKETLNKKEKSCLGNKIMNSTVSYERFEAVSKESLSRNSPICSNEDFASFISKHVKNDSESLQNKILTTNYGESYE